MRIHAILMAGILAATLAPTTAADHDLFLVGFDSATAYGDPVTFKAQLLEPDDDCWGNVCPKEGRQVDFYVNGEYIGTDVTNDGGFAYLRVTAAQAWHVGDHVLVAQYDREDRPTPATVTTTLTITEETTVVTAHKGYLEAQLTDDDNEPLVGFPVRFSVVTVLGEYDLCTAFTDATGTARCVGFTGAGLSALEHAASEYKATYDGSDDYLASSGTAPLV